jgi:hypothetical protein
MLKYQEERTLYRMAHFYLFTFTPLRLKETLKMAAGITASLVKLTGIYIKIVLVAR